MYRLIAENVNKYVHVHADCIPVKGACKSAIYDLTRKEITTFPSVYYDILKWLDNRVLGNILDQIEFEDDKEQFIKFIEFLHENEFIAFLDDASLFPPIDQNRQLPYAIENAIIDIDDRIHDFSKIFAELDRLGCQFVQLRSFSNILSLNELSDILSMARHKSIQGIELLLKYNSVISDSDYIKFLESQPLVYQFTLHSAKTNIELTASYGCENPVGHAIQRKIRLTTEVIKSHDHCGIINRKYLTAPSTPVFNELINCNGCMNRKISIDASGNIRNCPSMQTSFGHIDATSLIDVAGNHEFKIPWGISKDKIEICKDCELRYACTDCRAYIENPENIYSKPAKCSYNPYTGQWEERHINTQESGAMKIPAVA